MIKRRFNLAGLILIALVLVSCTGSRVEPLKVGTTVWVGYEPLYLAQEKDYLTKEKFHLVEFLSASQVMRGFRNKTIDVAALTMDEVMVLASEGFDPVVVLVLDVSNGADAIIAEEKYSEFSQLRGRRIGYENTAVGAYVLSRALEINNMQVQDVTLVSVNVNETEKKLISKEVDAVVTFEPARTRLLDQGYSEIFSSREIPDEIVDVLVVRKETLEKQREKIAQLKDGWYQSLGYYKNQKEDALNIMNRRLKLPDERLRTAFEGISFPSREKNLNMLGTVEREGELVSVANNLSERMLKNNLLQKAVDPLRLFDRKNGIK